MKLIFELQIQCSSYHISLVLTFKTDWARPLCNGYSLTLDENCASCHQLSNQSVSVNFIKSIIVFYNQRREQVNKMLQEKKKIYIGSILAREHALWMQLK